MSDSESWPWQWLSEQLSVSDCILWHMNTVSQWVTMPLHYCCSKWAYSMEGASVPIELLGAINIPSANSRAPAVHWSIRKAVSNLGTQSLHLWILGQEIGVKCSPHLQKKKTNVYQVTFRVGKVQQPLVRNECFSKSKTPMFWGLCTSNEILVDSLSLSLSRLDQIMLSNA